MMLRRFTFTGLLLVLSVTTACSFACEGKPRVEPDSGARPTETAATAKPPGERASAAPSSRLIGVILDDTISYHSRDQAILKIIEIVGSLGPNDHLFMANLCDRFNPELNVKLEVPLPVVPKDYFKRYEALDEWEKNQNYLDRVWEEVESSKKEIIEYLRDSRREHGNETDIFGTLAYCSQRFSRETADLKYLFIFSDLIHDLQGVKTNNPPSYRLAFGGAHVSVLFMPWRNMTEWETREKSWESWFAQGSALSFSMHDAAKSEIERLLDRSPAPRLLESPFREE